MEKKKKRESLKLVKINDAIKLVNQEVNLIGTVLERREPKRCRNNGIQNPKFSIFILFQSIIFCFCYLSNN